MPPTIGIRILFSFSASPNHLLTTPMVETSNDSNLVDRIRSEVHVSKYGLFGDRRPALASYAGTTARSTNGSSHNDATVDNNPTNISVAEDTSSALPPPAPPPTTEDGQGETPASIEEEQKQNVFIRFYETLKEILLSSIINVLLVFVPVGIALNFTSVSPTVVFAMNAIAIIPLAGLLSHATESVASSMGDTIGALMNVTFGNAVELIIL